MDDVSDARRDREGFPTCARSHQAGRFVLAVGQRACRCTPPCKSHGYRHGRRHHRAHAGRDPSVASRRATCYTCCPTVCSADRAARRSSPRRARGGASRSCFRPRPLQLVKLRDPSAMAAGRCFCCAARCRAPGAPRCARRHAGRIGGENSCCLSGLDVSHDPAALAQRAQGILRGRSPSRAHADVSASIATQRHRATVATRRISRTRHRRQPCEGDRATVPPFTRPN